MGGVTKEEFERRSEEFAQRLVEEYHDPGLLDVFLNQGPAFWVGLLIFCIIVSKLYAHIMMVRKKDEKDEKEARASKDARKVEELQKENLRLKAENSAKSRSENK